MRYQPAIYSVLILFAAIGHCVAEEPPEANGDSLSDANRPTVNLDGPTFGGKQFWTDELVHGQWRIQRNVVSRHYRLLDDRNVRRAWGTYEQCEAEFLRIKRETEIRQLKPRVVLVLHGLVRSRESMNGLCEYLEKYGDFSVMNVSYASTREGLAEHARSLKKVVQRLDGVSEVNFVAHSMGNLVIRHYLADRAADSKNESTPKIGRFVMLAAPNRGADLALRFRDNVLFKTVWGESGRELGDGWSELAERLTVPDCEFGIIAGGRGDSKGFNPWLEGDDDFVVAVDETRLEGARDFLVLPVVHGTIMEDGRVQESTLRFLEHGCFISEAERKPIPSKGAPSKHE